MTILTDHLDQTLDWPGSKSIRLLHFAQCHLQTLTTDSA